jgi:phytoene dehydrogenase-like protein
MSAAGFIFVMAFLHEADAGYPIGGSIPMAEGSEQRYLELGGQVHYNSRVEKILVEGNKAVGIRLTDGTEHRADYVVSAADGHATIFDMLEGKYVDAKIRKIYDTYLLFPAIMLVGIGVNRTFPEIPAMNGGISYGLSKPLVVAGREVEHLDMMIYNFDPTMAPAGKTVLTAIVMTDYNYWKELSGEPEKYKAEKDQLGLDIVKCMDERFPGLSSQVEMVDVASPVTFERYTGNWQGSFEGFLPTPTSMMASIPKTLPGLSNFFMAGQWVQAGGGLPAGLITGQDVIGRICKADGKKFTK